MIMLTLSTVQFATESRFNNIAIKLVISANYVQSLIHSGGSNYHTKPNLLFSICTTVHIHLHLKSIMWTTMKLI